MGDQTDEAVQLLVVKTLLVAVTSSTGGVHGGSLLKVCDESCALF
jgi:hypothetical protein